MNRTVGAESYAALQAGRQWCNIELVEGLSMSRIDQQVTIPVGGPRSLTGIQHSVILTRSGSQRQVQTERFFDLGQVLAAEPS